MTVSIDPSETPSMAAKKQQAYVASYGKKVTDGGWSFLTGTKDNIAALAKSIGFKYRRDPETGQYAHAAAVTFLTPDGKVARYLYGIDYRPQDLRLALAEAGKGHVGGIVDRLLLYCFHYDPQGKKYSLFAVNLLKGTAGVAVLLLGLMVWRLRRRES